MSVIDSRDMSILRVLHFKSSVRSVCQSLVDNRILVGTESGQIFESKGINRDKVLESHYGGAILWSYYLSPSSSSQCASCGED